MSKLNSLPERQHHNKNCPPIEVELALMELKRAIFESRARDAEEWLVALQRRGWLRGEDARQYHSQIMDVLSLPAGPSPAVVRLQRNPFWSDGIPRTPVDRHTCASTWGHKRGRRGH